MPTDPEQVSDPEQIAGQPSGREYGAAGETPIVETVGSPSILPGSLPSEPAADSTLTDGEDPTSRMSFLDHLVELRRRLIWSIGFVFAGVLCGLPMAQRAVDFMSRPIIRALHDTGVANNKLIYTAPTQALTLYITTGLYLGLVLALPFVLYQVWLFVAPGLYRHERGAVAWFIGSAVVLFLAGTAFGYYIMLPTVLKFLLGIKGPFEPMISINEYFDLTTILLLGLGVVFQLPILIFFLTLFGVVTPKFLWDNSRYAILIISIIAAIVVPTTDALTMLIFMAPMIVLYFVGIGVSALVVRRKRTAALARGAV
jgi:sec-independent protein translocase protein TatC